MRKTCFCSEGVSLIEVWQADKEPPLGTIAYRRLSPEEYKEVEKFLKNSTQ